MPGSHEARLMGGSAPHNSLAEALAGGPGARAALVSQEGPAVLRMLRYLTHSEERARDAFQDTFVAAFASANSYDPAAGALGPWLLAIARNVTRRSHRRSERERSEEPALMDLGLAAGWGADDVDNALDAGTRRTLLAQALSSLDADARELLLLRDVSGLSGEEAARVLGLSLAAQKSRLHRARLALLSAYREKEAGVLAQQREVSGMRCGDVLERLSAYVDGELAADERARIDAHLRGCSVCERFGGRFAGVVHGLRVELGAEPAVDGALVEGLAQRLADAGD
jgi:RNA polymerase sigma-70 factor, ECF subfamily